MSKRIDFYWDIGSTNTYFAFHLLRPLAARYAATINYVPFNLGYVFRHHNYVLMEEPAAKLRNRRDDLKRWAVKYELPFRMPDEFPIKTSRVLRGALAMRTLGLEEAYMEAVFRRYWEENDATIQDYAGLAASVADLGLDATEFEQRAESTEIRQQIIDLTESALARGIFGAPSIVVDEQLFWGKDRFDFVEDQLART
ncbi:MAG: 2-hydroxychromene-2-carboxylate isomerase [Pseudomonadota bacterium]